MELKKLRKLKHGTERMKRNVRLPQSIWFQIDKLAEENNISSNRLMEHVLIEFATKVLKKK